MSKNPLTTISILAIEETIENPIEDERGIAIASLRSDLNVMMRKTVESMVEIKLRLMLSKTVEREERLRNSKRIKNRCKKMNIHSDNTLLFESLKGSLCKNLCMMIINGINLL